MNQIKYKFRGVVYTLTPTKTGEIELRANGIFVTCAQVKVRIESTCLLGGENESSTRIYAGLETEIARALVSHMRQPRDEAGKNPMPEAHSPPSDGNAEGPWYITMAAVEEYCRVKLVDPEEDFHFNRAESELKAYARAIVAEGKEGKLMDSGARQFRGPKPHRIRLLVSYEGRAEGELPQLISVKPDHDGRRPK